MMYERHWQLTNSPFRRHSETEFFCRLPGHQSALLKLRFVLEQRQASAALIGPTGIGKSFLMRVLEADLPPGIGPVVLLNFPCLTPLELVRYLAMELSAAIDQPVTNASGLDEWLHGWDRMVRQCHTMNRMPVLVVDDAHLVEDRAVWQTWQLLLAHRDRAGRDFSTVFIGQPELLGRLQRFPALEQRLALVATLAPLSESETADYVTQRLSFAGRTDPVFDASALRRVWECSGGIPRRIDRLCDFSLLVGYADGLKTISAEQIDGVFQELRGRAAA
jgi:type II secretory pathway predicted ATPase ExeA